MKEEKKIPVPFRLAQDVVEILERRKAEIGCSKTSIVERAVRAWDKTVEFSDTESSSRNSLGPEAEAEAKAQRQAVKDEESARKTELAESVAVALPQRAESKPVKLCEHGFQPAMCKHSKCRQT